MPDNAILLVDRTRGVYLAPPCVEAPERYVQLSAAEARRRGLRPEPNCRESGAFGQEDRSLSGALLQRLGLLGPIPSRWNADGTWKW